MDGDLYRIRQHHYGRRRRDKNHQGYYRHRHHRSESNRLTVHWYSIPRNADSKLESN